MVMRQASIGRGFVYLAPPPLDRCYEVYKLEAGQLGGEYPVNEVLLLPKADYYLRLCRRCGGATLLHAWPGTLPKSQGSLERWPVMWPPRLRRSWAAPYKSEMALGSQARWLCPVTTTPSGGLVSGKCGWMGC
ncbi:hypothetical protein LIA77_03466 [Sarocladium implicatum]|nr:hypothetical protein LIA77_03466 [Sarocladium implicatum]